METQIKECPFCGSKAEVRKVPFSEPNFLGSEYPDTFFVSCTKPGCIGQNQFGIARSPEKAIELWNTRYQPMTDIVYNTVDETWECKMCRAAVGHDKVNYCEECGRKVNKRIHSTFKFPNHMTLDEEFKKSLESDGSEYRI